MSHSGFTQLSVGGCLRTQYMRGDCDEILLQDPLVSVLDQLMSHYHYYVEAG